MRSQLDAGKAAGRWRLGAQIAQKAFHSSLLAAGLSTVVFGALTAAVPAPARAETCPNEQFRTGSSAGLPQCRAYEMVTPSSKNGGLYPTLRFGPDPESFEAGEMVELEPRAELDPAESDESPFYDGYYALQRTAGGWKVTGPVQLPESEFEDIEKPSQGPPVPGLIWRARRDSEPADATDLYLVSGPGAQPQDFGSLGVGVNRELMTTEGGVAVSSNLQDLVFEYPEISESMLQEGFGSPLVEFIGPEAHAGEARTPIPVSVNEEGEELSQCGAVLGKLHKKDENGAISANGSRIFFTAIGEIEGRGGPSECAGGPPVNELFARVDNGGPEASTVAISEPSEANCAACNTNAALASANFLGASEDGSKVFFETIQPLLGGDSTQNIYEYDFEAPAGERIVRVSGGDSTVQSPVAEVLHEVQISQDGSHVYFTAKGVLTTTPNEYGQVAQAGQSNLYVFDTLDHETRFIATTEVVDAIVEQVGYTPEADTTPDGRYLVFVATADLTPGDTSTAKQVFEYDSQTGELIRVSIGQQRAGEGGYNEDGNTNSDDARIVSPRYEVYASDEYWDRLTVSADGADVFFTSADALTPQAVTGGAQNVYEYHSSGTISDGNVYLISDGRDAHTEAKEQGGAQTPIGSELIGTDPSGQDVFFTTVDQLTPQDQDTALDVYDARVDGGFPAPSEPSSCSGNECQGPLSAAPTLLFPGSEIQPGGGNLKPAAASKPAPKSKSKQKKQKKKKKKKKKKSKSKSKKIKSKPKSKKGKSAKRRAGR